MDKKQIYKKILLNILCLSAILLCIKFVFPYLISLFLPFIVGYIIALIAEPLVRFLEKNIKIKRKHSTIFIILGVLAGIVGIIYCAVRQIYLMILSIINDIPSIIEQINSISTKLNLVVSNIPKNNTEQVNALIEQTSGIITNTIESLGEYITLYGTNILSNIPMFIFGAFITFLSAYFMIKDNFKIKTNIFDNNEKFKLIKDNIIDVIINFFKGQFKIMSIIFVILTFGFGILGVKYFVLVALIVAFVDLLPILGTGTILYPWIAILLIEGDYGYAIALFIIYLIALITRQLLQPKVISQSIGLEPLPTLVFMFIGFKLWGFGGLIFAPPIGIILIKLYNIGIFDNYKKCIEIIFKDIKDNVSMKNLNDKNNKK